MSEESDTARFERTVKRFIRECIGERARESVFQGWLLGFLAVEFGWARVYREIHVQRNDLLAEIEHNRFPKILEFAAGKRRSAMPPDVAISDGNGPLDCRSSGTRCPKVDRQKIIRHLPIVAELKVMGAKKEKPGANSLCDDLERLELWAAAARKYRNSESPFSPYMIVLDNWGDSEGQRLIHTSESLAKMLDECKSRLINVLSPTIIIGRLSDRISVDVIRV